MKNKKHFIVSIGVGGFYISVPVFRIVVKKDYVWLRMQERICKKKIYSNSIDVIINLPKVAIEEREYNEHGNVFLICMPRESVDIISYQS